MKRGHLDKHPLQESYRSQLKGKEKKDELKKDPSKSKASSKDATHAKAEGYSSTTAQA